MCLAVYRIVEKFITAYKGMQIFKGEVDSGELFQTCFLALRLSQYTRKTLAIKIEE